ncbi:Protein phosphatase 2C-like protein [Actinidia chinensis var. chinensis]|uniref:Protein phosphatase 2C-like protein n=1 Tax=Actinidia chinensis var. chinensis TaxID=1590841 RepID=A0A2R6PVW1_ACTCC|nr:Protein phosphatase 2C-like protein [Actinidia chinensis var. chinensis]
MGFKDLHLKLKAFRLRRFLIGDVGNKKREEREFGKVPSWMVPVTHGYHVVENGWFRGELGSDSDSDSNSDSVVVQREQIDELELWFFGVFNARIGDGITKYLQSHLFDKNPKQSQLKRKSKDTLKKAYLNARAKIREAEKAEERERIGSASALVINGEKLVIAHMGDYRAVVCRDGEAHQVSRRHHQGTKRHWSHKLIPGVIRMPKVRILAWDAVGTKSPKSLEIKVGDERIDSDTEFVILASNGIWEVMNHQEAVNLIRHMEDPQEAAESLAKEALTRMSRSNISCLVIRFD